MTSKGRTLPKDIIKFWPEVFGEIKLNVLPLGYLHTVLIRFKDGKTWEIKVTKKIKTEGWESFEKNLSELVKTYEESIEDIDFRLDTEHIKKDIEKSTQKFLKKRKL